MTIDQVGLAIETEPLHVAIRDGCKLLVREVFAGLKIDGNVQHIDFGPGVELVEPLKAMQFFGVSQPAFVLQKILRVDEPGLVLCYLILIVKQDTDGVGTGLHSCDHS